LTKPISNRPCGVFLAGYRIEEGVDAFLTSANGYGKPWALAELLQSAVTSEEGQILINTTPGWSLIRGPGVPMPADRCPDLSVPEIFVFGSNPTYTQRIPVSVSRRRATALVMKGPYRNLPKAPKRSIRASSTAGTVSSNKAVVGYAIQINARSIEFTLPERRCRGSARTS
jgi:hypothetical protein